MLGDIQSSPAFLASLKTWVISESWRKAWAFALWGPESSVTTLGLPQRSPKVLLGM